MSTVDLLASIDDLRVRLEALRTTRSNPSEEAVTALRREVAEPFRVLESYGVECRGYRAGALLARRGEDDDPIELLCQLVVVARDMAQNLEARTSPSGRDAVPNRPTSIPSSASNGSSRRSQGGPGTVS